MPSIVPWTNRSTKHCGIETFCGSFPGTRRAGGLQLSFRANFQFVKNRFQVSKGDAMKKKEIKSLRELGRAVGRSHTAVRRWLAHDEWPFAKSPPWKAADVAEMKRWAEETLRAGPIDDGAAALEAERRRLLDLADRIEAQLFASSKKRKRTR